MNFVLGLIVGVLCIVATFAAFVCCFVAAADKQNRIARMLSAYRYDNYVSDLKTMRMVGSGYSDDVIKATEHGFVTMFE